MNTTPNTKTKRLVTAVGVAAAAAVAPALLFAGTGTAHACSDYDTSCLPTISDDDLAGVTANPGFGGGGGGSFGQTTDQFNYMQPCAACTSEPLLPVPPLEPGQRYELDVPSFGDIYDSIADLFG